MNKNSGFSLIELLVTIGISGIVILMISYILVQGTTLFKDENEAIDIQGELQIVRNQISETLMGAKSVVVVKADDGDIVIYTGDVDEETNKLENEPKNLGETSLVTTERIITYIAQKNAIYISSTFDSATSEGNMISDCVTSFSISLDEKCKKEDETNEDYYVNPLSVDVAIELTQRGHSSNVDMNVRVRNILKKVIEYKIDKRDTLLKDATSKVEYMVK